MDSPGFLFFGWNAAEQHLTSLYQETEGATTTGLNALAILYGSIIIGNFFAPLFVKKTDIKLSIFTGFITYILLVFGVVTKITFLILGLSALMGMGCAILGVAQIDLLRVLSPKNSRGELTGSVNAIRAMGGALGVSAVSLLLRLLKIESVYLALGGIMAIGLLILLSIKQPKKIKLEEKAKPLQAIKKTILMFKNPRLSLSLRQLLEVFLWIFTVILDSITVTATSKTS